MPEPRYVIVVLVALVVMWALIRRQLRLDRLADLAPRSSDVPAAILKLYVEYCRGRLNPPALEALRKCAAPDLSLTVANLAVSTEVAAGRYAEALEWRALCPGASRNNPNERILRVNEAEALANLGKAEESLAWLDRNSGELSAEGLSVLERVANAIAEFDGEPSLEGIARSGALCHRAWCLATLGKIDAAEAALGQAKPDELPKLFVSEYFLSKAAVSRAAGRWEEARLALDEVERHARRASTKRNVHFMRGLLFAAQGRYAESLEHFEKGARCEYVGQGGDALLGWGDALAALDRGDEARKAWALCADRDPQSPAAATAKSRLENGPRRASA